MNKGSAGGKGKQLKEYAIIVILGVPLEKLPGSAQIADLHSGAGLFAPVAGPLFERIKQLGKRIGDPRVKVVFRAVRRE